MSKYLPCNENRLNEYMLKKGAQTMRDLGRGSLEVLNKSFLYDWGHEDNQCINNVMLLDETLRDGLQSNHVKIPTREQQLTLIENMERVGIEFLDIGYPQANKRTFNDILFLLQYVNSLNIKPACAGRTVESDITPIAKLQQRSGVEIEGLLFIGVSRIRQYVEGWDLDFIVRTTSKALRFAAREGIKATLVIEDATRAAPSVLGTLYELAIDEGIDRIAICDTVGECTPAKVDNIIKWSRGVCRNRGVAMHFDWHGHNDRGLAVANSMQAIYSGCDRIHGTALGIGERAGNASMDGLITNLHLEGRNAGDVSKLSDYINCASEILERTIPIDYPVFGDCVFNTASGIHASAMLKAMRKQDDNIADYVYSSVPARKFGLSNRIEIGAMSGRANVLYWLANNKLPEKEDTVEGILQHAKACRTVLTDQELFSLYQDLVSNREGVL